MDAICNYLFGCCGSDRIEFRERQDNALPAIEVRYHASSKKQNAPLAVSVHNPTGFQGFLQLPLDMHVTIFKLLGDVDIWNTAKACKLLRGRICRNRELLKRANYIQGIFINLSTGFFKFCKPTAKDTIVHDCIVRSGVLTLPGQMLEHKIKISSHTGITLVSTGQPGVAYTGTGRGMTLTFQSYTQQNLAVFSPSDDYLYDIRIHMQAPVTEMIALDGGRLFIKNGKNATFILDYAQPGNELAERESGGVVN